MRTALSAKGSAAQRASFCSSKFSGSGMLCQSMGPGGYAYARSQEYIQGSTFQLFTYLRGIGIAVFVLGGVLPLVWFMVTRWFRLKPARTTSEPFVVPPSVLAIANRGGKDKA